MLYTLFSHIVVTHLDTIETKPCSLGWHCTPIISSVIDCDRLCRKLYGNQQINTSPLSSSLSILNKIFSMIVISAILVELPEWKADCNYLYTKLFLLKIF